MSNDYTQCQTMILLYKRWLNEKGLESYIYIIEKKSMVIEVIFSMMSKTNDDHITICY